MNTPSREEILQNISDLTKDATGHRERENWDEMSDAELVAAWNYWANAADETCREEREAEARNYAEWFERLTATSLEFRVNLSTAIRWDMDAEDIDHSDVGYYCHRVGIPFGEESKIRRYFVQDEI